MFDISKYYHLTTALTISQGKEDMLKLDNSYM